MEKYYVEIGYINGKVEKKYESENIVFVMRRQSEEVIKAKKNPDVRYVRVKGGND